MGCSRGVDADRGGGGRCRAQPCLSFLSQAGSRQAGRKGEERPRSRIPPSKGVASPPHCPGSAGSTLGWGTPTHRGVLVAMVGLPPIPSRKETGALPGSCQPTGQIKPPKLWRHCPPVPSPPPQHRQPADDHLQGAVGALDEDQGLLAGPIQRRPTDVHQLVTRLQLAGQSGLAPVLHLGDREGRQGGRTPQNTPGVVPLMLGAGGKETLERGCLCPKHCGGICGARLPPCPGHMYF